MSTRYAKEGSPLRQERFASSFPRGLLANLVAKRCAEIDPPADRAAIWFAQWYPEGLVRLAHDLLKNFPLSDFREETRLAVCPTYGIAQHLADTISDVCLNPARGLAEVWEALDNYRAKWISELPAHVETCIGKRVADALEYAQETRSLVLIYGPPRIGKSVSARAWCDRTAGLARYVQVPCSNDDAGFFRAIGRALGVSASLQLKASEIRNRIEDVLQSGDLMLVLDESQYCWPQSWQRYAMPMRVNWILQALVNFNVPVALVTTPSFFSAQKRVEDLTGWTSSQLIGRIGHVEKLPDRLGRADLVKVAKALLPAADADTWGALAAYATVSKKNLASIEDIAKRATWLASQDGKQSASAAYVRRAMRESIIPSDTALAESLAPGRQARRSNVARLPRMARGYAAAAGPSIPTVDDLSTLITEPRGSLVTT
jgi:hypothetical protein